VPDVLRLVDFLADLRRPPLLFVSPASRRCLLTVAAAIRFAVAVLRPLFLAEDLIFSYCRVRFALLTPRGGIVFSSSDGLRDPKERFRAYKI
jgi:hypothetical protein